MDFRSLTRRELQALCKKNKIPANITNVAMADALQALDLVEGIEDFLKPSESDTAISSVELPQKSDVTSQSVPSTGRRTAQRKTVKNETETSQASTRTRNSTRRKLAGNVDDEVVETPVVPTVGRRAAAKEKQDVHKTPGAMLISQKREAKEKSSVGQVYSIRRSARLAAKRLKESGKQDNERSDQTITFDNFSEAATEGLEVNSGRCSLHFEDEVEKAGIDLKTASDEGLDRKKAKEGATDLSAFSFETENLNLLNKELKVDMPKSSEELATSDNTNAIIENNVDMLLSEKLGEGEESNDDKAMKLDSSLDIGLANFVLAENSANNGLSDGKESHCDECLNVPDSYVVEVGLQDPHVLPVAPKSSSCLDQEVVVNSDMVPKQMDESNEPNANKISTCEAGDADFTLDGYSKSIGLSSGKESHCDDCMNLPDLYDCDVGPDSSSRLGQVTVSDGMILPKQLKEPSTKQISVSEDADIQYKCPIVCNDMGLSKQLYAPTTNLCEVEDVDLQCKVQEVVGKDDTIKHISDCEVQGADIQCEGQQIVGDDMVQLDNEDEPNTEENDLQCKVQEVVGKDDNVKPISGYEVQGADIQCKGQHIVGNGMVQLDNEDEPSTEEISDLKDDNADHQCRGQEVVDDDLVLSKQLDDEDETNTKEISYADENAAEANSEILGEGPLDKLTSREDEAKAEGISNSEDEDNTTQASSENSDGEQLLEEFRGDENGPKAKGISHYEDSTEGSSESSDGEEQSSEEFTGDENEISYKALYYSEDEDASEAISENSDAELSFEECTGDENDPNYKGFYYSEDEGTTAAGSESLDSELSLDEFIADENKPNTGGLSYSEDEDAAETGSESLDVKRSLEKLTGDEKEPNNEGLSYSEDEVATEAGSESSGRKESLGEFAGDSAETNIWQLNNEAESKNIESSELLQYASEANLDAVGDKKAVQEYLQNSTRKEPSGQQNVVEAPFVFLESSVPQVDLIGGTPLSALAFDHKQIPSGSAETTNLGHTIQMICSTPLKKSSSKTTPTKTPITRMSAGLKCVSDDKENVDNSGRKQVRLNNKLKLEIGSIKENKKKHHEDCSPGEITKSNANAKEATRPALQQLQENCLVGDLGNTIEG